MNGGNPEQWLTNTQIQIFDYEEPPLPSGSLSVTVKQTITVKGKTCDVSELEDSGITVAVSGPQFSLSPQDIASVYPAPGSAGDYQKVIPHVILTRSTLSWERNPGPTGSDGKPRPWLALIVMHKDKQELTMQTKSLGENEPPDGLYTVSLDTLLNEKRFHIPWLPTAPSKGSVQVMKVSWSIAKDLFLFPAWEDLPLLAHVRQSKDPGNGQTEQRRAVILARPRFIVRETPVVRDEMTAYLVSLENWYQKVDKDRINVKEPLANHDSVLLVVLKSWTFTSIRDKGRSIKDVFDNLKLGKRLLSLPLPTKGEDSNPDAQYFLSLGAVPLPHVRRSGKLTTSFYHGPLVPWKGAHETHVPEKLTQDHKALGLSDVSYSAASELGRLMMLHDPRASRELFNWKTHASQAAAKEDLIERSEVHRAEHLPLQSAEASIPFPAAWFERIIDLEGVPFAYLVPDERMLPRRPRSEQRQPDDRVSETIRFFEVDRAWIEALVNGAFSVGVVGLPKKEPDGTDLVEEERKKLLECIPHRRGFLLRSSIVSEWPQLHFEFVPSGSAAKHITRRLAADVELHLFPLETTEVTLFLALDTLHFEWPYTHSETQQKWEHYLGKTAADRKTAFDLAKDCLYRGDAVKFNKFND